jgi:molybdopterin-guanine dinucleotide biosynthesis protein A
LTASPGAGAELAAGHLFALGYAAEGLRSAHIEAADGTVRVRFRGGEAEAHRCAPLYEHIGGAGAPHVVSCDACAAHLRRGRAELPAPAGLRSVMGALLDGGSGVHGAALVRETALIHRVEDVGRHAAVDRLVGAALLRGWDAEELGIATTARVSAEIAYKAARAGFAWVASRSVPTTLALDVAALVGLPIAARAGSPRARVFEGGPARRFLGAVLAGGRNTRYGAHKALEAVGGTPIALRAARALRLAGCRPVVLIANEPEVYAPLGLPSRPDSRPGLGPLGGLHAALLWALEEGGAGALVVAGDMPFASPELLGALATRVGSEGVDAAVPESEGRRGVEPLCAAYAVSCLPAIEATLAAGGGPIVGFYDRLAVARIPRAEVAAYGDADVLVRNVNTPAERDEAERLLGERR